MTTTQKDLDTARRRAHPLPVLVLAAALTAMLAEALGLSASGSLIRNSAVGLMAIMLIGSVILGEKLSGGGGLPFAFFALGVWTSLRVFNDTGMSPIPFLLALWFPFIFFVGYTARTRFDTASLVIAMFGLLAAALFLSIALGEGAKGAPAINSIYYSVLSLPFVLAVTQTRLRIVCMGAIVFATAASDKRTAAIALVLGLLAHGIAARAQSKRLQAPRNSGALGLALVMLVVSAYWVAASRFDIDILKKILQIDQDGGSGRGYIYQTVLNKLMAKDFIGVGLGAGQDGVAAATGGVSAHNDFLEVSFDYGLIGLAFVLLIYLALLSGLFRFIASGNRLAGPWAASIVVFTVMAMFSHVIFVPTYVALLTFFWGLAARDLTNEISALPSESQEMRACR